MNVAAPLVLANHLLVPVAYQVMAHNIKCNLCVMYNVTSLLFLDSDRTTQLKTPQTLPAQHSYIISYCMNDVEMLQGLQHNKT